MDDLDQDAIKHQLFGLETEHRDLDDVIAQIADSGPFNQVQIQRLKKRKLMLKDEILRLKSKLIPDSIA